MKNCRSKINLTETAGAKWTFCQAVSSKGSSQKLFPWDARMCRAALPHCGAADGACIQPHFSRGLVLPWLGKSPVLCVPGAHLAPCCVVSPSHPLALDHSPSLHTTSACLCRVLMTPSCCISVLFNLIF